MRVCIHQPDFVPYLGFFQRLMHVDLFVILDDVQFLRKGGWHRRDLIKTNSGSKWLTLGVEKAGIHQKICDTRMAAVHRGWIDDNLNLIQQWYRKAAYFDAFFPEIEKIYRAQHDRLVDFNMSFMDLFFIQMDIQTPIVFSSDISPSGASNDRLINILKTLDARTYLTGTGSKAYLDEKLFEHAGISVEWQQFKHPVYPQLYGEFLPGLSCLDSLLNCGAKIRDLIRE